MRRRASLNRMILFALSLAILLSGNAIAQTADTIIAHARIYTVNPRQAWADSIAIQADKILGVGSANEIAKFRAPSTKMIDAGGRLLLPGFTDSHIHFLEGSVTLLQVHLDKAKTIAEIQKLVKDFADKHPSEPWILGRGWTYPTFGPSALPDKKYLDEVVPDRPVYLVAFDGHTAWANSKALALAGITKQTPDPPNGSFVRDASGEATGAIKEDADSLFRRVIPIPSREERLEALRAGMKEANRVGLVRVHCAGNDGLASSDFENLDLYDELHKKGELSLRMYVAFEMDPPGLNPEKLAKIEQARKLYHDEWVSAGAIKFFLDGVIESHTAAMLAPYSDDPKQIGAMFWDPEQYKKTVQTLDQDGFQIFTHAIGDKAVRTALDAYDNAAQTNHTANRPRIEHIETISAQDIPRFGKLDVIASFQPLHAYPDEDTLQIWARNAGPERAQRAWAWRSIQTDGGHLAFGSDWPVVTLNPWYGLQTALTRQTRDGDPPGGFVPRERLSLEDAIRGYTFGAAYAGHREQSEGSLEPGKLADMILLSQDLFKIEPSEISQTELVLTMVGGKIVYQSPAFDSEPKHKAPN